MKATTVIPDDDIEGAGQLAAELGLSRSERFVSAVSESSVNAVREFVDREQRRDLTNRPDRMYDDRSVNSRRDPALAMPQGLSLPGEGG